jgi:hypothetical protein
VTVHVFYNPDLVGQLEACGITARRRSLPSTAAPGFVLEGRSRPPRAREAVTNTIAVQGHVTITGPRQLPTGRTTALALPVSTSTAPQTALELVEECARLHRDNQRLSDEVARLRTEVDHLTAGPSGQRPQRALPEPDDAAQRFALIELDL